jgi:hypothetical protein
MDEQKFEKLLQVLAAPQQWKADQIDKLIQQSLIYSQFLQTPQTFARLQDLIAKSIFPPERAQNLADHVLFLGLSNAIRRPVLVAVVQSYIHRVPEGADRARRIISDHIRNSSVHDLLCEAAEPEFSVYVIATNFLNGRANPPTIAGEDLARGAAKAIVKKPSLFPSVSKLIARNFAHIDTNDLVLMALSSAECMKFVLSQLVPLIVDGNLRAYEVIQRIAAAGRSGEPACLVADFLKQHRGITCLMAERDRITGT